MTSSETNGEIKELDSSQSECVKVVVRCRPMSEKEVSEAYQRVVEIDVDRGLIEIKNPKNLPTDPHKEFYFDAVYDWNSKQLDLYDETFRPLVNSVLEGFNGTIFAYGQTGTGKTYTMEGIKNDIEQKGVIPNAVDHIFKHIARSENRQYLVRASFLEIYQEEIRDLLAKDQNKRLELKERPDIGVYVKDLSTFVCKSVKEIEHVMNIGNQNRSVGATNMNLHSSRSHAIFIITIEHSEVAVNGPSHIKVGKLNLVDLAGSERQAKTGAVGERQKEAIKINLSLSALGNVISALVDGRSTHIPYRDSKLTRLLQDSLGGNSKTIMVANIGPASYNYEETVITLRYASRAKKIKNKPRVNEDPKDALLREFQQEIERLKGQLATKSVRKKKKLKKNKDGGDVTENSEDDEAVGLSEEDIMKEQDRLNEERMRIVNDRSMLTEEKDKILNEMATRQSQLNQEQEARDSLSSKIKAMESKLLTGGINILDHTNEQQRALEKRRQELAEQKTKQREMLQLLECQEEETTEIKETYTSLQQEAESKTRKLKKLFSKLQAVKAELQDEQDDYTRQREELQIAQYELNKELKLKYLIIENFIPPAEKAKLLNRLVYDEDDEEWRLLPVSHLNTPQAIDKRPISAPGQRRPISEYAKMAAAMDTNPRYKAENILITELDMPSRTTKDYDTPVISPHIQAAFEDALREEEDANIDAYQLVEENRRKSAMSRSSNRPRTSKPRPQTSLPDNSFPQPMK